MKKLYIIRHAKSSWEDFSSNDFDRDLSKRGKLNAPFMGDRLRKTGVEPDIIVSSPALRARITAEIIAKKIKFSKKITLKKKIYEASFKTLRKIVTELPDDVKIVFLFGHNPGLNEFAQKYIDFYENIPTCGIVEIEFDCETWMEVDEKNAKLIMFDYPKKH